MKNETTQRQAPTYYWASWRRVAIIGITLGLLTFFACLTGGVQNFSRLALYLGLSSIIVGYAFLVLGVKFVRIMQDRLSYQNGHAFRSSTDIANIKEIKIVSRFAFTDKATRKKIHEQRTLTLLS